MRLQLVSLHHPMQSLCWHRQHRCSPREFKVIRVNDENKRTQTRTLGNTTGYISDFWMLIIQRTKLLSIIYLGFNPITSNFFSNTSWSTISKAFLRSRKIVGFTLLRSMFTYQMSVLLISDAILEYNIRKAEWLHVILSFVLNCPLIFST